MLWSRRRLKTFLSTTPSGKTSCFSLYSLHSSLADPLKQRPKHRAGIEVRACWLGQQIVDWGFFIGPTIIPPVFTLRAKGRTVPGISEQSTSELREERHRTGKLLRHPLQRWQQKPNDESDGFSVMEASVKNGACAFRQRSQIEAGLFVCLFYLHIKKLHRHSRRPFNSLKASGDHLHCQRHQ